MRAGLNVQSQREGERVHKKATHPVSSFSLWVGTEQSISILSFSKVDCSSGEGSPLRWGQGQCEFAWERGSWRENDALAGGAVLVL